MALQYDCPPCATTCDAATLPTIVSQDCPEAVTLEKSEIVALYIGLPDDDDPQVVQGNPDVTTIAGIEAAKTAGSLLVLPVIGDMPAPEKTTVNLPRGQKKTIGGRYAINADFFDLSIANYDGLRALQCGLKIRFWFETQGGFMYGGDNAISGVVEDVSFPKERGQESYAKAVIKLSFDGSCDPPKALSPYTTDAESGGGGGGGGG